MSPVKEKGAFSLLVIHYQSPFTAKKIALIVLFVTIVAGGLYVASLFAAPAIAYRFFTQPISINNLSAPQVDNDRLVIPRLGVDIPYSTGSAVLEKGAQWRDSNLGNPEDGGVMLLAAHRFSLQTTPQQTNAQSFFYSLEKMQKDDTFVIDYHGTRYAYKITGVTSGQIADTPLPSESSEPLLVLYTYDSDQDATRTIVTATPLGKVAL